ncbi:MAG: peptide-methionine (S)-S-oxide reductase MsrA [Promethearchaeota archaeon]
MSNQFETATLGGGCFWCLEAIFHQVTGIEEVVSGYSGGYVENPSYQEVCTGMTGHAEVIQLKFNPNEISFHEILEIFFYIHDPTTLNRQGNDVGPQYRSIILYHTPEQKIIGKQVIKELEMNEIFSNPIVTEIVEFNTFYPAEEYHQEYYSKNMDQSYCSLVISPKVAKFRGRFFSKLKRK